MSPEDLFREQMKQQAFAKHAARIAGTESYDFEGYLFPAGGRFRNGAPVRSHAEARAYARGQIAQAVMHKPGITGGEYRITHVMPRRAPQVIEHVIVDGKTPTAVILNGQRVPGTEHIPSRFDAPRENPRRGHRLARRNPRARPAPKHPMVVLVRRFDPSGEELSRWEVLVRDEDGRPEFFSPSAAMEAALNPSDDADLRVGDIVATVPAEAISKIEDSALGLYVMGLHGMKKAPDMPGGVGRRWLSAWGKDARAMLMASVMVERKRLVMAACDCAETVLHLVPAGDTRSRAALDAARAWCQGKATLTDVLRASTAIRKLDDFPATWSAALASSVALAENRNSAVSKATGAESSAESAARDAGVSFDQTNAANANLVERWIPLPVALLSCLGQADVFRLDPQEGLPANLRENPRSRPRRRGRR